METLVLLFIGVVLLVFVFLRHQYYAGTPWRRAFFRVRRIYDITHAKATARDDGLVSSQVKWLAFLREFYKTVCPALSEGQVQQQFDQIEGCIAAFSDRHELMSIIRQKFPHADEARVNRVMETFERVLNHPDNRSAILKIFVFADLIGRETNDRNRLEFLYTALAEPKTINL